MSDGKLVVIRGEGSSRSIVTSRIRYGTSVHTPHPVFSFLFKGEPYVLRLTVLPGGPDAADAETPLGPPPVPAVPGKSTPAPVKPPAVETFPVGKRDLQTVRIGRRKRRIYRVADEDLERGDCWLSAPGWYVDTLKPPATWLSNDPFGPYQTAAAAEADAHLAYRGEEA